MKKTLLKKICLQPSSAVLRIIVLLIMASGMQTTLASAIAGPRDTIVISKAQGNKKYKIKLYPNATHEVIFFTAVGEEGKIYQLFVFDMESKLIKQTMVRNRQTSYLTKFNKGEYTYEVFSDDERIENGSVIVK